MTMPDDLADRLRGALRTALRARDLASAAALRSALAALGNAEAVPASATPAVAAGSPYVAGAATGLGAAEKPRRRLSPAQAAAVVQAEIDERRAAAAGYEQSGRPDRAARLRAEADALAVVLD